jgi:hypothetical protein
MHEDRKSSRYRFKLLEFETNACLNVANFPPIGLADVAVLSAR